MDEPNNKEIRIFYSWQSDLPKETNRNGIRNALRTAAKELQNIVIDEATRDTVGGINIPKTILDKIDIADILVADVSTIGEVPCGRKCPNPNVVFELGYAVSKLGWERIVLVFNLTHGSLADLPFDFDRHRISAFKLSIPPTKEQAKLLENSIKMWLAAIIRKNPKRPAELIGLSRTQIEHNRDVENLKWVLTTLHLPTIDKQILDLPSYIHDRALFCFEEFEAVAQNSLFHINDKTLLSAIVRFYKAWSDAFSYTRFYNEMPSGKSYAFYMPGDVFHTLEQENAWNAIKRARTRMRKSLDDVLRRVREGYIEVDINETNKQAHLNYVEFQKEIEGSRTRKKVKQSSRTRR